LKYCAINVLMHCVSSYDRLAELELPLQLLEELMFVKNSRK